jgi:hypothetical protein
MKKIKYVTTFLLMLLIFSSCAEENYEFGDINTPTNLIITPVLVGKDANNPFGDGSGKVNITAKADNAISYKFIANGEEKIATSGYLPVSFTKTGVNKYTVTVVATGKGGVSSSSTIEIEVLALYEPPAELVTILNGNSSRTWRIKAESNGHFGLGPVGGSIQNQFFPAPANSKSNSGMYDDRFTFKADGTFTHNTGADGTVFGRQVLIEQLNGPGGTADGADIIQYPFASYNATYSFSEVNTFETITITGTGFIGYYTGGNHQYRIFKRSANEMILSTADGNNEFEWWFVIVPE